MCLRRLPHLFAGFCTLWKLEAPDIQGFLAMCHYYDTFPTATIIDTGICCGTENGDKGFNNAGWRMEFSATNTFFLSELLDAIFISAPKNILIVGRLAHVDVIREDVDDITQNLFVQIWAGADILKLLPPVEHLQNKWFYILLSIIKVQSVEVNLTALIRLIRKSVMSGYANL